MGAFGEGWGSWNWGQFISMASGGLLRLLGKADHFSLEWKAATRRGQVRQVLEGLQGKVRASGL
jgi:hypothetical protein